MRDHQMRSVSTTALELLVTRPEPPRRHSSDGEHQDTEGGLGLSEQIHHLQATLHDTELALKRERDRALMLEQEVRRLRDNAVAISPSPSTNDMQALLLAGKAEQDLPVGGNGANGVLGGCDGDGSGSSIGGSCHGREFNGHPHSNNTSPSTSSHHHHPDMVMIPRKELELLQLKNRALDSVKEGITIADCSQPDMPIIYANEAFARLTGYATEYAVGRNCRFLQGEGTDPATVHELRTAIQAVKPCVVQLVNYKRNGDPFMNYLSLTPVVDVEGKLTHFVGVQADVTELIMSKNAELAAKNAAVQAAAATEAKSQFLARMSHEIRTPLNGMIAVGELLAETSLSPAQWDLVNTIRCSGETLLTLITDILDFSRIEANKMVLSYTTFRLQTVVEAAMEIAGLKAAQKRLHVAYHINENVPRSVILDAQRLQQILLNILNNAVKFTERGEILLEVWCRPPTASELEAARKLHRPARDARKVGGRGAHSGGSGYGRSGDARGGVHPALSQHASHPGAAASGMTSAHTVAHAGAHGASGESNGGSGGSNSSGGVATAAAGAEGGVLRGCVVVEFSVTDTGIGIGAGDLGRLFKSFSQVDASPTRRYGGSGLGLAISKKLCEAMGGSMTATSEGLGKGTRFHWTVLAGTPPVRNPGGGRQRTPGAPPLPARAAVEIGTPKVVGGDHVNNNNKEEDANTSTEDVANNSTEDEKNNTGDDENTTSTEGGGSSDSSSGCERVGAENENTTDDSPTHTTVDGFSTHTTSTTTTSTTITTTHLPTQPNLDRHEQRVLGMLRGKKLLVVERNHMVREVLTRALTRWGCRVLAVATEAEAVRQLRIPEPIQNMLLEEYEGVSTTPHPTLMSSKFTQGQLRLHHAPPLHVPCEPHQEGAIQGPFDVVLADVDAGLLLHGLIAADAGEADRVIFLAYPGQPNPVYPPKSPSPIHDCDSSCSSRYSQLWSEATSLTTMHDQDTSGRLSSQASSTLYNTHTMAPLTPPASPAPTQFLLAEGAAIDVPLIGSRAPRQVGFVVVPRPLRQGRLKLALEEVLSTPTTTPTPATSQGPSPQEALRTPLSMLSGGSQTRSSSVGDMDAFLQAHAGETRIMLAEDNPINMKVACGILRRMGYDQLVTVADGQQALEEIERRGGADAFDIILTDLHMPFKGGMEVAMEVRRQYPASRVCMVAVTADAYDDTRDTCLASGFDDWLPKPFRVEDMMRIMRRCLEKVQAGGGVPVVVEEGKG